MTLGAVVRELDRDDRSLGEDRAPRPPWPCQRDSGRDGEARTLAGDEPLTHPTFKRYLVRRRARLQIDRSVAGEEEHLDGKT